MYRTAIALLISFLGGIYLAYNYQENKYEAQISKERLASQEALTKEKDRGEAIVATYVEKLRAEAERTSNYEHQAYSLVPPKVSSNGTYYVSFGFIRLFNASATGETTSPASTDNLSSSIDITTVLSTVIENNGKYREVASQIEANKVYFSNH